MTRQVPPDTHWRDASRRVKFFVWDGQVVFPLVVFLFYMRLSTLIITLVAIAFFSVLNRFAFTPIVFLRLLRSWAAGPRKLAKAWWDE